MKKMKIMTTILAGVMALGMTACGSKPTETTATPTEPSVVESTTEATTSETTEATTVETTAESTAPEYTPEEYAFVMKSEGVDASEFTFVDASYTTKEDGSLAFPTFTAGQNIVISFKCDKEFKFGEVTRAPEQMDSPDFEVVYIAKTNKVDGVSSSTIAECLTYVDGTYTLTIPAEYAVAGNVFSIRLSTASWLDDPYTGEEISFYVRCA